MTPESPDAFDQALSQRLAQLSAMPVDTSRLDRALRAAIAPAAPVRRRGIFRSFAAIAASLIFVILVGMAFLQNRSAQAAPELMLQLHRDMVSGRIASMQVDSVDDVNRAFAAFGQAGVQMNAPPEMQLMACCLQDVGNKKVACILLKDQGTPVTLTVADLDAVRPPASPPIVHNGETFHMQTGADLNMITVDRGQHRICLIGPLPAEKLMALTDHLKF